MKIRQILDMIDENQLFVPAFQREYVWKRENAKDLINSLIHEYPTGTMLTWSTNNPPELKGTWIYNSSQGAVKLILDGQQRITTLYMLIRGKNPPYYTDAEITVNTKNLYVNVKTMELQYYKKNLMDSDPFWINITDIFQKNIRDREIIKQLSERRKERLPAELEDLISDNVRAIDSIPDHEFVEQCIPVKATLKEAIDIFYIVNSSGVNLTDAELALAQISGFWPKARELFKRKLEALKHQGFNFNLDFIVYCLLGIIFNIGSDMTKLHNRENENELKKVWKKLDEELLDYVINILHSQAYVDHSDEINSVYALIPIIVYTYKKQKLNQNEINKIIKWFYYSQIRQRYISQLPQKLDKDIGIVVRDENPFDILLNNISLERPLELIPEEFVGVDIRNALYSLMRFYFKSKNAICLNTGIGIRKNMGDKYSLEWDHIFPYSILKERGYGMNNRLKYPLAQEITNRAVLTQLANRQKSNLLPIDYLRDVKRNFPEALSLQSIPEEESLWQIDAFEDFLRKRRTMLAEELNYFLKNITETIISTSETTIEDLISEGESEEIEFKSSLRWSYQEDCINNKLEAVIVKSIAAFSNGSGGILLIGINDEGQPLGLDRDYTSLDGTKDEFELHLRNLINSNFDKHFTTSNIDIDFPIIEGKEICKLVIQKGKVPLFLNVSDKNGVKQEKFYVRSGNSSQEFSLSETSAYIKERF